MGMHAQASVVYGIDLGDEEYGESYVEVPEKYLEDGLTEGLEDLIAEYRGWIEEPVPYAHGGEAHQRWSDHLERKFAFLKAHPTVIGYGSYGYQYSGTVLTSAVAGSVEYAAGPLSLGDTNADELEKFLQFLESKGFKFDPDKRKAQWLLTASYG